MSLMIWPTSPSCTRCVYQEWMDEDNPYRDDDGDRYTAQEAFDEWYGVDGPDPDSTEGAEAADRFRNLSEMAF